MNYKKSTINKNRIYFLDNLRTFMIFLVVLIHAGGVYEDTGFWGFFWIVDDPATHALPGYLFLILDIFVMSTIFFISGFLTPLSLKNKKGFVFIKSKFKRLMIPWIIAVLTLMPLYKMIFLYSRNLPQENWTTYFHWSNEIWSQNWLWFLPVLFLFDLLYMFLSKLNIKLPNINLKTAVGSVFVLGVVYSFLIDILGFQGWTKTIILDFQNERLFIYFMIFMFGSLCHKLNTFESKLKNKRFYMTIISSAWIPIVLYRFFYTNSFINNFVFPEMADTFFLWLTFHLSLLGLLYLLINSFRFYFNRQGLIGKELSQNSYNVYIIHTIVLGGLALTMINTAIPSLIKFFILTFATYVVSNILVYFYRKTIKSQLIKRKEITMKTVINAIAVAMLLFVASCGSQEKTQSTPKPPKVGLHVAVIQGNLEAVNQHIKAGSDLNEAEPSRGSSPLITAAVFGRTEIAKALIDGGADVDYQNKEGSTALHSAAFFCHTEIVKALLDKNANKTLKNLAGRIALESVSGPFEDVKGFYEQMGKSLAPIGLKLDLTRIEQTRPQIAKLLQ
jgi:fucose 4-O-acetylase-like acetyltransferase